MKSVFNRSFRLASVALCLMSAAILTSCNVDDSYDLSAVSGDNIGFGTDESTFDAPLADITIDASKLVTSDVGGSAIVTRGFSDLSEIETLMDDLSNLAPEGEDFLDINRLAEDSDYLDLVVEGIQNDATKQESLADLIYSNEEYQEAISEEVPELAVDVETTSKEDYLSQVTTYIEVLEEDEASLESFKSELKSVATAMQEQCTFDVSESLDIDLDEDVLEMLGKNLDGDKNTLRLVTTFTTDIPLELTVELELNYTDNYGEPQCYKISVLKLGDDNLDDAYSNPDYSDVSSLEELKGIFNNPTLSAQVKITTCSGGELTGKKIWLKVLARKSGSIIL